jgi:hypothetical protein
MLQTTECLLETSRLTLISLELYSLMSYVIFRSNFEATAHSIKKYITFPGMYLLERNI